MNSQNNKSKNMKATEAFAKTIGAYIEKEKQADPLFAKCVDEQAHADIIKLVEQNMNLIRRAKAV